LSATFSDGPHPVQEIELEIYVKDNENAVTREELCWKYVLKKAQIQCIDNVGKGIGMQGSFCYQKFKEDWTCSIPQN
jgi:hypothetical protein